MSTNSKKEIRETLTAKLSASLADYASVVGEKKFKKELDRTARRLGRKIYKALPKEEKEVELKAS